MSGKDKDRDDTYLYFEDVSRVDIDNEPGVVWIRTAQQKNCRLTPSEYDTLQTKGYVKV